MTAKALRHPEVMCYMWRYMTGCVEKVSCLRSQAIKYASYLLIL